MAVLLWVRSKNLFLKIQEGTGGALSTEDISNGFFEDIKAVISGEK